MSGLSEEELARVQRMHDNLKGHGNGEMQRDRRALSALLDAARAQGAQDASPGSVLAQTVYRDLHSRLEKAEAHFEAQVAGHQATAKMLHNEKAAREKAEAECERLKRINADMNERAMAMTVRNHALTAQRDQLLELVGKVIAEADPPRHARRALRVAHDAITQAGRDAITEEGEGR